jgi:hypothetical protein
LSETDEIVGADEIFDGCRKKDLTGMTGTLTDDRALTLAGYAGREFSIDSDEIRATVTYRMYWVRPASISSRIQDVRGGRCHQMLRDFWTPFPVR